MYLVYLIYLIRKNLDKRKMGHLTICGAYWIIAKNKNYNR